MTGGLIGRGFVASFLRAVVVKRLRWDRLSEARAAVMVASLEPRLDDFHQVAGLKANLRYRRLLDFQRLGSPRPAQ